MTPESNPTNYPFPAREVDVSQEIRERHFSVLENQLKSQAFDYASENLRESNDLEAYRHAVDIITVTKVVFDGRMPNFEENEKSYTGFISEFIKPAKQKELLSSVSKELE